ncbi:Superoxide dismutase [Cu-Zn] 1 precursor [Cedecea neteri]|uniref:Superoxide dismutase [Cu-Zn] 1 n=1 Tax=Cedecea neteri TaxID=158822 RepID=A0A291DTF8_9ENTR|nr:superoxide dismutase family protein [Cedecea neteri]ATF90989.1 superoxide dismutase [Cu-Zn] SodC2 [Cedecea neteri]SQA99372.1 Superoxide dismutase [Cu-Zn] 1 precursor [Cedecea neteri]
MNTLKTLKLTLCITALACTGLAQAATVTMNTVDAKGTSTPAGTIEYHATQYGVVFTPNLKGLPPGIHGFHVHTNPNCGPGMQDGKMVAGLAAGGHLDPAHTGKHEGPWGNGHLGDLPALYVDSDGTATYPVLAPRLRMSDLKGHSLMIHAGGDNHSDHPAMLGGGGARMVCGVTS